jgi:hypothetical protein
VGILKVLLREKDSETGEEVNIRVVSGVAVIEIRSQSY